MALLSLMRNYGSTSSTTTLSRSVAGGPAALPEGQVKMRKMECHESSEDDPHQDDLVKKPNGKRRQTGFVSTAYSFLLVSVVMAITLSALTQPINANPTCILNCAQCVKIYGEFFDGHSCAKVCMDSRSKFDSFVDCADPTTIARFLKSF